MSYERSSSLASYAWKRLRRIYPAYFTIVVVCALGLIIVSAVDVDGYFSSEWVKYLLSNLFFLNFLQHGLPGVFTDLKFDAVNGALWTLKIEVMFYLSVPVFVYLFRRIGTLPVIVVTYVLSIVYVLALSWEQQKSGNSIYAELARQLPGQLSYFMAGAFLYYYLPFFEKYLAYFFGFAALVFIAQGIYPVIPVEPLALGVLVVFFGLFGYLGNFGKYGDFSYGIYIIHFPVIQVLLHFQVFQGRPGLFLILVVLATLIGAMAMWHLVEKRFLLRNNHYVAVTK